MSIDTLLSRLKKVRKSGNGSYMACCAAHDDKTPSLSIKDVGDGRILINCMAGCATEDVLAAIGMEWSDIMPERVASRYAAPVKQRIYPADALKSIQFEARIIVLAAFNLRKDKSLSDEDMSRVEIAMERINTALEVANVY